MTNAHFQSKSKSFILYLVILIVSFCGLFVVPIPLEAEEVAAAAATAVSHDLFLWCGEEKIGLFKFCMGIGLSSSLTRHHWSD